MSYYINKECTRCGICVEECPTESIIPGDPIFLIDADTCGDCALCVPVCPVDAIHKVKVKP